jgi:hypothetical protein
MYPLSKVTAEGEYVAPPKALSKYGYLTMMKVQ